MAPLQNTLKAARRLRWQLKVDSVDIENARRPMAPTLPWKLKRIRHVLGQLD
jgi:hypothetical protein